MVGNIRVAIVGCGLIGTRRAREVNRNSDTHLEFVVDSVPERRDKLAEEFRCQPLPHWKQVVDDQSIDLIIVSTPNNQLAEIGTAALQAGKHVLVEKPPGRNLGEARQLAEAAKTSSRVLKIGFNHRYHPAISKAKSLVDQGVIGDLINIRARYGHGGRPGYEKEWRGDLEQAGGGELTDQGVHVADLVHWFAGVPSQAFALLQTAVWPISPLEDNAFGLFSYDNGIVASFHTSWTQWKNLFSFEVYGQKGSVSIEGLGGSYEAEKLTTAIRNVEGGAPKMAEEVFDQPDYSWRDEWNDLVRILSSGEESFWGSPNDGIAAMTMIHGLYESAQKGIMVSLDCGKQPDS